MFHDRAARVLINHSLCDFFSDLVASCHAKSERGGILVGLYRGPHIELTDYTNPGPRDVSSLMNFIRQDDSHQKYASALWRRSKFKKAFIGEWHTHPFGSPKPSTTDLRSWRKTVKENVSDGVFVIVSPNGWAAYRVLAAKGLVSNPLIKIEHGKSGIVFGS